MQGESLTAEARYRAAAGSVVRKIRTDAGWSLREFGEQVGVAHTSLHAIERGETTPTIDTLARIGATRGLAFPAILALIVDEIDVDPVIEQSALSQLLGAAAALTAGQIEEILSFIEYIEFRDRQT